MAAFYYAVPTENCAKAVDAARDFLADTAVLEAGIRQQLQLMLARDTALRDAAPALVAAAPDATLGVYHVQSLVANVLDVPQIEGALASGSQVLGGRWGHILVVLARDAAPALGLLAAKAARSGAAPLLNLREPEGLLRGRLSHPAAAAVGCACPRRRGQSSVVVDSQRGRHRSSSRGARARARGRRGAAHTGALAREFE